MNNYSTILTPSNNNYHRLTLHGVQVMVEHILNHYEGAAAHLELDSLRDALLPEVAPTALLYILKARTVVDSRIPVVASMADAVAFDY